MRRQSASEIQWRQASATEVAEKGGLAVSGGNGYIDPLKAIGKLKKHGRGLWAMQAVVAFAMSVIAVVTGEAQTIRRTGYMIQYATYHTINNKILTVKGSRHERMLLDLAHT